MCIINDLYVNYAKVSNSQFDANSATYGGAIYTDHGAEVEGSFVVNSTIFISNYASEFGGGLFLERGDGTNHSANFVYYSTFRTNVAENSGGAIYIADQGFLNVMDSQFLNNSANAGYVITCSNSNVNIDYTCEFSTGNYSQLFENQQNCTGNLWTHCSCSCNHCVKIICAFIFTFHC